eukprot:13661492-Alexandrium_andersonii.AAC.1
MRPRSIEALGRAQGALGCQALAPLHVRPRVGAVVVRELSAWAPVAQDPALAEPGRTRAGAARAPMHVAAAHGALVQIAQ